LRFITSWDSTGNNIVSVSFYSLTCDTMFYKIYWKLFILKVKHYMFRRMRSSSGVKTIWQGNYCLLFCCLCLLIHKSPRCTCVWVGGLYSLLLRVALHVLFSNAFKHNRRQYNPPTQTHIHISGNYILTYATKQKTPVSSHSIFKTWWWPYWLKHVVINF
jgi:hypothetical protein